MLRSIGNSCGVLVIRDQWWHHDSGQCGHCLLWPQHFTVLTVCNTVLLLYRIIIPSDRQHADALHNPQHGSSVGCVSS